MTPSVTGLLCSTTPDPCPFKIIYPHLPLMTCILIIVIFLVRAQ
jgi:hypothetical protein